MGICGAPRGWLLGWQPACGRPSTDGLHPRPGRRLPAWWTLSPAPGHTRARGGDADRSDLPNPVAHRGRHRWTLLPSRRLDDRPPARADRAALGAAAPSCAPRRRLRAALRGACRPPRRRGRGCARAAAVAEASARDADDAPSRLGPSGDGRPAAPGLSGAARLEHDGRGVRDALAIARRRGRADAIGGPCSCRPGTPRAHVGLGRRPMAPRRESPAAHEPARPTACSALGGEPAARRVARAGETLVAHQDGAPGPSTTRSAGTSPADRTDPGQRGQRRPHGRRGTVRCRRHPWTSSRRGHARAIDPIDPTPRSPARASLEAG